VGRASAFVGAEQARCVKTRTSDEFECDLARIRVLGELTAVGGELHRLRHLAIEQLLAVADGIAHGAGLVVVLAARRVDRSRGRLAPAR
jgi:hypothetical protein